MSVTKQKTVFSFSFCSLVIGQILFVIGSFKLLVYYGKHNNVLNEDESVRYKLLNKPLSYTILHRSLVVALNENRSNMTEIPFSNFKFPLDINFRELVRSFMKNEHSDIQPINHYPYKYLSNKCKSNGDVLLFA